MIHVIASITIQEGRLSEFLDIFKSNMPNVIEESGCIEYVPTIDVPLGLTTQACNRNVVTIIEKWQTLEDLKKHLSSPHMLAYREKVKDYVENVSLKILKEALSATGCNVWSGRLFEPSTLGWEASRVNPSAPWR